MKKTLTLLLLTGTIMLSCNNEVKQARIGQIDSLQSYLPEVEAIIQRIDSTSIARRTTNIERNTDWVFENVDDTLGKKFGLSFGDYGRLMKLYSKMNANYRKLKDEYAYTEKQLNTLEKDVKNNFYSAEEFEGYFATEEEALLDLLGMANSVNDTYYHLNERYNKLHAEVDSFITATKEIIYAPVEK